MFFYSFLYGIYIIFIIYISSFIEYPIIVLTNISNKYVFTNPWTGNKYDDIKRTFKTVCKLADVKNMRFHDLRHTAATRMVDAGIQLPVVKRILNHANIQTTMRYAHTMREQEVTAVEVLANYNC